jgi:hypothetical protein
MFIDFDMGSFLVGQIVESHNHGTNSQIQSIEVQNASKLQFSNVDWCEEMVSDMEVY